MNATLYSLPSFEVLDLSCDCKLVYNSGYQAIKCSWEIDNYFKYVSVALSTFSVAHAITLRGYLNCLPGDISVVKKGLFYIIGVTSVAYGSTIGIYQVYMAGLTKTPWFLLLIFLLFLRMAPLEIWNHLLRSMLPSVQYPKCRLCPNLSLATKNVTMIISLFWFWGVTRGLECLANLLTELSQDLFGANGNYPFASVYPSINLRYSCIMRTSWFDCYQLNGWIDVSTAAALVEHVYPILSQEIVGSRIDQLVPLKNKAPMLQILYGNHLFLDTFSRDNDIFHSVDIFLLYLFSFFLLFLSERSKNERFCTHILLMLQNSLVLLQLSIGRETSQLVGVVATLPVVAFATTTVIAFIVESIKRSVPSRICQYLMKYVLYTLLILIPIYLVKTHLMNPSDAQVNVENALRVFVESCQEMERDGDGGGGSSSGSGSKDELVNDHRISHQDSVVSLSSRDSQAKHISVLKTLESEFFASSYSYAFWEIYHPILLVLVLTPLACLTSFDVVSIFKHNINDNNKRGRFARLSLLAMSVASAAVLPLYLTAIKPRFLWAWDWSRPAPDMGASKATMSAASSTVPMATTMQGDNDITSHNDDDIPSLDDYELDASFILSKNSSKRVFDLDAMDEEHRRAIFRQIRNRIWMAVRGERSMSGWCLLK